MVLHGSQTWTKKVKIGSDCSEVGIKRGKPRKQWKEVRQRVCVRVEAREWDKNGPDFWRF